MLIASVAIGAVGVASVARAQARTFDVPAQAAVTGIPAFARQAEVQILISESSARGRRTSALRGTYVVPQALGLLLSDSGLHPQMISANTYAVLASADVANQEPRHQDSPKIDQEPRDSQSDTGQLSSMRVEEVVVSATRTERSLLDVPAAVSTQNLETLRQQGFAYGTDEFRGVPGINFRRGEGDGDASTSVTIRGVSGNHGSDTFLTLIDGVPFMGPDEEVLLSEVPYDAVSRVEIVRGPSSALYGRGALSGAINYLTLSPRGQDNKLGVSLATGSDSYHRASLSGSYGFAAGGGALANVSYENYDGWRERSNRERLNFFGKAETSLTDSTTLSGYVNYMDRSSELATALPTTRDGALVPVFGGRSGNLNPTPTHNNSRGLIGAVRLQHEVSDALTLTITGQMRRFDTDSRWNFYYSGQNGASDTLIYNGYTTRGSNEVLFGETMLNWRTGIHELVMGVSVERTGQDEVDSWFGQYGFTPECGFAFYEWHVDRRTGEVTNADHPCQVGDTPQTIMDASHEFVGVFVQDEIRLGDAWRLTVGGRYDDFKRVVDFTPTTPSDPGGRAVGSAHAFSPKAALSYRYGSGQVYFAYGRGFGSNFGALWQWSPSLYARDDKPTTLDSVELGWKVRALDDRLSLGTTIFALEQKNRPVQIDNPDADGAPYLFTTGRRYQSRGVEFEGRYEIVAGTTVFGAYTYLDPEWKDYELPGSAGGVDLSGLRPVGVPSISFSAGVERVFAPWFTARASYEHNSDYAISFDNSVKGGSYELVNLSGTFALPWRYAMTLDLAVTNLLDEEYAFFFPNLSDFSASAFASPGPPRQIRATLRANF